MNKSTVRSLCRWLRNLSYDDKKLFEEKAGRKISGLISSVYAGKHINPKTCAVIEVMSGGKFHRLELRSDYRVIWFELEKNDNGGSDGSHAN